MALVNNTNLVQIFKAIEEVVQRWQVSSTSTKFHRGADRKAISAELFEAFENLAAIGGEANDQFHAGARAMVLAITDFAKAWFSYTDRAQAGDDVSPSGDSSLWNSFEEIRKVSVTHAFRQPEPVEQLIKQDGVAAWQVARIYGWKDGNGQDDVRKVQEELENPGMHYDPKTWVHPSQAMTDAAIAKRWNSRVPADVPASIERIMESANVSRTVAPESLETLIRQRVPIDQICTMKGVTRDVVEQEAANLGVTLTDARRIFTPDVRVAIQEREAETESRNQAYEAEQKKQGSDRKSRSPID